MNDLIILSLNDGHHAIIDAADAELVAPYEWKVSCRRRNDGSLACWAYGAAEGLPATSLHHLIMPLVGAHVDHKNRNGLDNRRANLRSATIAQNAVNRGKPARSKPTSSRFKGVSETPDRRWIATVVANHKSYHGGTYVNEEDAARAYDRLARIHHGEFAVLNFPDDAAA